MAQDLSGFWKGTLSMSGGCFPQNNIELQLTVKGGMVSGASYHYLNINYYVKKKFEGRYDKAMKTLVLQEGVVTTFNIPSDCKVCIKIYELAYSRNGDVETLSGNWRGKIQGTNTDCSVGPIVLTRIRESAFKEVPEIAVDSGDIRLDFYDNGVVDGDSVTLLVNKKVVLSHERLGAKPVTSHIRIDASQPFQEIEMLAENTGTIPPNTALLIITAGKKRYRLFLSSSEEKSARVRFVYEPD